MKTDGRTRSRWGSGLLVLALALLVALAGLPQARSSTVIAAPTVKKTCHWVTKKVHGKAKKVKVCKKVTPTPTRTPKPTKTSTAADEVAKRLVDEITAASTDDARYDAVLRVMDTLHIGVVDADGKGVVAPGQGLPAGFQLYTVELRAIAGGLGRGDLRSLDDLAFTLAVGGVEAAGQPLPTEQLREALLSRVRDATAAPQDPNSLIPALVRELGLRHPTPYDMTQDVPADRLQLDALQVLLVTGDILVGLSQQEMTAAENLRLASDRRPADGPCTGYGTDVIKQISPVGKWALSLIKVTGNILKGAAITLDAIHGPMLAYSVKVTSQSPETQTSHYGPAGHRPDAGRELRFKMRVEMLDDYGEYVINCGALIGLKFPKRGGIPGVTIMWNNAESNLERHGTVTYEPADHKTDGQGYASLVFHPNDEEMPGFGLEKSDRGVLDAIALYQSAFGNIPGTLAQFITPKQANFVWLVTFHKPRGFRFDDLTWQTTAGAVTMQRVISGRVCGTTPYGAPWTVNVHYLHWGGGVSGGGDGSLDVTFPSSGSTTAVGTAQISFSDQPSPHMSWSDLGVTASAPIVEDTSCPETP